MTSFLRPITVVVVRISGWEGAGTVNEFIKLTLLGAVSLLTFATAYVIICLIALWLGMPEGAAWSSPIFLAFGIMICYLVGFAINDVRIYRERDKVLQAKLDEEQRRYDLDRAAESRDR